MPGFEPGKECYPFDRLDYDELTAERPKRT